MMMARLRRRDAPQQHKHGLSLSHPARQSHPVEPRAHQGVVVWEEARSSAASRPEADARFLCASKGFKTRATDCTPVTVSREEREGSRRQSGVVQGYKR